MDNNKLKIPVVVITIVDMSSEANAMNEELLDKNTYYNQTLCNADKLKELGDVAHLFVAVNDNDNDKSKYPLTVKWLRVGDDVINVEDGSFQFEKIADFNIGSFDVEYSYDAEIDEEIPKYIVISKN